MIRLWAFEITSITSLTSLLFSLTGIPTQMYLVCVTLNKKFVLYVFIVISIMTLTDSVYFLLLHSTRKTNIHVTWLFKSFLCWFLIHLICSFYWYGLQHSLAPTMLQWTCLPIVTGFVGAKGELLVCKVSCELSVVLSSILIQGRGLMQSKCKFLFILPPFIKK